MDFCWLGFVVVAVFMFICSLCYCFFGLFCKYFNFIIKLLKMLALHWVLLSLLVFFCVKDFKVVNTFESKIFKYGYFLIILTSGENIYRIKHPVEILFSSVKHTSFTLQFCSAVIIDRLLFIYRYIMKVKKTCSGCNSITSTRTRYGWAMKARKKLRIQIFIVREVRFCNRCFAIDDIGPRSRTYFKIQPNRIVWQTEGVLWEEAWFGVINWNWYFL